MVGQLVEGEHYHMSISTQRKANYCYKHKRDFTGFHLDLYCPDCVREEEAVAKNPINISWRDTDLNKHWSYEGVIVAYLGRNNLAQLYKVEIAKTIIIDLICPHALTPNAWPAYSKIKFEMLPVANKIGLYQILDYSVEYP